MRGPQQSAHAPKSGEGEGNQEAEADEASRGGAFAPALEHGDQSNHKQDDGDDGKSLHPHGVSLLWWRVVGCDGEHRVSAGDRFRGLTLQVLRTGRSPPGTTETSPAFQRRVGCHQDSSPDRDG